MPDPGPHTEGAYMGSATRCSTSGFFHESVSPKSLSKPLVLNQIFSKIYRDIRRSKCTTHVVNTGCKCKKNLHSEKFFLTPLGSRFNKHINNFFYFKFISRCHHSDIVPTNYLPLEWLIPVVHLGLRISPRIFKKYLKWPTLIFRGLGEDDSWKNLKQKISWHCPFNHDNYSQKLGFPQASNTKNTWDRKSPRHNVQGQIEQGHIVMSLYLWGQEKESCSAQCPHKKTTFKQPCNGFCWKGTFKNKLSNFHFLTKNKQFSGG